MFLALSQFSIFRRVEGKEWQLHVVGLAEFDYFDPFGHFDPFDPSLTIPPPVRAFCGVNRCGLIDGDATNDFEKLAHLTDVVLTALK